MATCVLFSAPSDSARGLPTSSLESTDRKSRAESRTQRKATRKQIGWLALKTSIFWAIVKKTYLIFVGLTGVFTSVYGGFVVWKIRFPEAVQKRPFLLKSRNENTLLYLAKRAGMADGQGILSAPRWGCGAAQPPVAAARRGPGSAPILHLRGWFQSNRCGQRVQATIFMQII